MITDFNFQTATRHRPVFCQATGPPVFSLPRDKPEGAERREAHQQFHACEARRASCAVDKFTQSAQTSTRHARLSALHRGDFGRRDCSNQHPDRPFGLLIPRAFACVRPGAIYQLWRALVVGPGSTPRLPEMACETIRNRCDDLAICRYLLGRFYHSSRSLVQINLFVLASAMESQALMPSQTSVALLLDARSRTALRMQLRNVSQKCSGTARFSFGRKNAR